MKRVACPRCLANSTIQFEMEDVKERGCPRCKTGARTARRGATASGTQREGCAEGCTEGGLVGGAQSVVVGVAGPAEVVRIRAIGGVEFLEHLREQIAVIGRAEGDGHFC